MTVRKGASLINIMVFVMFAMMVTAQVFFYTATSFEGLTDEREIMSYRLMLDSIVRLASTDLALNAGERSITHTDGITANYQSFYRNTQVEINHTIQSWDISAYPSDYHATIHDLDYEFHNDFNRDYWIDGEKSGGKVYGKYNSDNMHQKLFAAMNPPIMDTDVDADGNPLYRYYLLRAYVDLPEKKFYGRKLMYQVLFRRYENIPHTVELKSFQEIWF